MSLFFWVVEFWLGLNAGLIGVMLLSASMTELAEIIECHRRKLRAGSLQRWEVSFSQTDRLIAMWDDQINHPQFLLPVNSDRIGSRLVTQTNERIVPLSSRPRDF